MFCSTLLTLGNRMRWELSRCRGVLENILGHISCNHIFVCWWFLSHFYRQDVKFMRPKQKQLISEDYFFMHRLLGSRFGSLQHWSWATKQSCGVICHRIGGSDWGSYCRLWVDKSVGSVSAVVASVILESITHLPPSCLRLFFDLTCSLWISKLKRGRYSLGLLYSRNVEPGGTNLV